MVKWTRRMRISIYRPAKLARKHGIACRPFWILTVEWFWWRHRFQITSFLPSTLENSVFKKHRFQIAPLWRAFSNGSVFGDCFRRCSVDDSRIRSKTAPFSFENGLVWTGPYAYALVQTSLKCCFGSSYNKTNTTRTELFFTHWFIYTLGCVTMVSTR